MTAQQELKDTHMNVDMNVNLHIMSSKIIIGISTQSSWLEFSGVSSYQHIKMCKVFLLMVFVLKSLVLHTRGL